MSSGGASASSHARGRDEGHERARGHAREAVTGPSALRLPHRSSAVREARRRVARDLLDAGAPEPLVDEVEVVVSELLGNAVRHARALPDGRVGLRWQLRSGTVDVEVADGGSPTPPAARPPDPWGTSGRGLSIICSLADEWGVVDPTPAGGRAVWAALGGPTRRSH